MEKPEWVALPKEQRLAVLREKLQNLIALEKEQKERCRNKEQFKKVHLKHRLEKEITNILLWDSQESDS